MRLSLGQSHIAKRMLVPFMPCATDTLGGSGGLALRGKRGLWEIASMLLLIATGGVKVSSSPHHTFTTVRFDFHGRSALRRQTKLAATGSSMIATSCLGAVLGKSVSGKAVLPPSHPSRANAPDASRRAMRCFTVPSSCLASERNILRASGCSQSFGQVELVASHRRCYT